MLKTSKRVPTPENLIIFNVFLSNKQIPSNRQHSPDQAARMDTHMGICCSHGRSDSSHAAVLFFPTNSKVQIRLRKCAGSYGYSLFSCGVRTPVMFWRTFFNRPRIPDQAARMRRLIWIFAVLMWRRDSSHVSGNFYQ